MPLLVTLTNSFIASLAPRFTRELSSGMTRLSNFAPKSRSNLDATTVSLWACRLSQRNILAELRSNHSKSAKAASQEVIIHYLKVAALRMPTVNGKLGTAWICRLTQRRHKEPSGADNRYNRSNTITKDKQNTIFSVLSPDEMKMWKSDLKLAKHEQKLFKDQSDADRFRKANSELATQLEQLRRLQNV